MSSTFKTKIVRPNGDEYPCSKNNRVTIPFYEEYGVQIKNNLSERRMFELLIDGESAGNGRRFILDPKQEMTIWRWLEGSMNSGSKFLFLPSDHPQGQHKAERPEAGIVRVKMWTEEPKPDPTVIRYEYHYHGRPWYQYPVCPTWPKEFPAWCETTASGSSISYATNVSQTSSANYCVPVEGSITHDLAPAQDVPQGVTGKGAESNQRFYSSAGFNLGSEVDEEIFFLIPPQDQAVAVEEGLKPEAHYCGHCKAKRKNKNHIFCPYCGRNY